MKLDNQTTKDLDDLLNDVGHFLLGIEAVTGKGNEMINRVSDMLDRLEALDNLNSESQEETECDTAENQ